MPKSRSAILAVDTETTSLTRPYLRRGRRIWDLAIIRREPDGIQNELQVFVRLADLGLLEMVPTRIALDTAVPIADRLKPHLPGDVLAALEVGDFWGRHPEIIDPDNPRPPVASEKQLAELLMSGWLAPGADLEKPIFLADVPPFDDLGLYDLLYRHRWINTVEPWHYHHADIGSILGGALRRPPQWDSAELSRAIGVDPDKYPRHTALGDAQWVLDRYDAVYGDEEPGAAPGAAPGTQTAGAAA